MHRGKKYSKIKKSFNEEFVKWMESHLELLW